MKSNVKKNFVYQIMYQILISVLPFITSPYISRVIGASGIGIYSYTYSIAHYFTLFGNLGISIYGNRLIARTRDDKDEMNMAFSSLFSLHLILCSIVIFCYVLYVVFIASDYKMYALIQILYLIAAALDISWLFFGLEKFKLTVTRNSIIKIITTLSVFIFVKTGADLWKYILILALGNFIGQVILWSFFKKYASFHKFHRGDILVHIKPMFTLFFAAVAVSIYSYMDKIMIGALSSTSELGYYENAWKMIEFPVTFVTALGTVMLPRISNLQTGGHEKEINQYIFKSLRFSVFTAIAIMFGLFSIADDFAVVFWGADFARSGALMKILSITILFMAWNGVVRQEYLIPHQKDNVYLAAVCTGAVLNVIFNSILIPFYGAAGASVGTVVSYSGIFIVQNLATKGKLGFRKVIGESVPYVIFAGLMMVGVRMYSRLHSSNVLNLTVEILMGVAIYGICSFVYVVVSKDAFMKDSVNMVLTKVNKKWKLK
ncbi:MAG: flippase [Clostridiales bacterium]|nr:flippase [Clostridiales bacterium]